MAEFLTRDMKLAISSLPETAYNTMRVGSTDTYFGMLTTGRAIYVPDKEKQDDTGKVGTGREFPTEQRSGYLVVPSLEITEELNIDVAAVLARRAMGGADTVSAITSVPADGGIKQHLWGLATNIAGRQLPSSTMLWSIGGADYMWGGVVVESFRIDQTNSGVPTFTAGLIGSGLFKRLRFLTANGALAVNGSNPYNGPYAGSAGTEFPPSFPLPVQQRYMLGAETQMLFTPEGGSSYSITGNGQRAKSFSATLTNNHRTDDRRPGDLRVNSAQPRAGHYVNRMNHGDRTIGAEMVIMLDDTMTEFDLAYNDTIIDSFLYRARGPFLKSAGADPTMETDIQSQFELEFPKCYFRSVRGSDDSGDAVLTISIFPVDNGTTGPLLARVRNNSATVIS